MHEKLPMAAFHSMPDDSRTRKRGEVGIPALLILLGTLLAYTGGLVRTSTETPSTPSPVTIDVAAPAGMASGR